MLLCETGFLSVEPGSRRESLVLTMQLFLRERVLQNIVLKQSFFSETPSAIERNEIVKNIDRAVSLAGDNLSPAECY